MHYSSSPGHGISKYCLFLFSLFCSVLCEHEYSARAQGSQTAGNRGQWGASRMACRTRVPSKWNRPLLHFKIYNIVINLERARNFTKKSGSTLSRARARTIFWHVNQASFLMHAAARWIIHASSFSTKRNLINFMVHFSSYRFSSKTFGWWAKKCVWVEKKNNQMVVSRSFYSKFLLRQQSPCFTFQI